MSALKLIRHRGRRALRRLYSGPLGTYIDPIAAWYFDHGYERSYASASLKSVDRFGRWVHRQGLQLCDINEQLIGRYLLLRMPLRSHSGARVALRRLLAVLREGGASPPPVVERGTRRSWQTTSGGTWSKSAGSPRGPSGTTPKRHVSS